MAKKIFLVKPISPYCYTIAPNLGLGYIASSLRSAGHRVDILDCDNESMTMESFERHIGSSEYDIVGFQLYTNSLRSVTEQSRIVRRHMADALIIAGGPHTSGDPVHSLESLPDVDIAVIGEGEEAVKDIALMSRSDIKDTARLGRITNIAYRMNDGTVRVNEIRYMQDLDAVSPAWDLIDPRKYPVAPHGTFVKAFPVAPIITSRGCPYSCTFCASFRIHGRKIRRRRPESVVDEIEMLNRSYGVKEIHIEDDNFTMDKNYVTAVLEDIIRRGINICIALPNGVRIDALDEKLLLLMERSGCYSFGVGIESGSDRILKAMKKNITTDRIEAGVNLIKRHTRIRITGFFLIGHPDETEADIMKSVEFAVKLKLDRVSFSPLMPLPGCEIYDDWKKKTGTDKADWGRFLYYQFIPGLSPIDPKRLESLLKKANFRFYLRPRIMAGILREVKTPDQMRMLFKRAAKILTG